MRDGMKKDMFETDLRKGCLRPLAWTFREKKTLTALPPDGKPTKGRNAL